MDEWATRLIEGTACENDLAVSASCADALDSSVVDAAIR